MKRLLCLCAALILLRGPCLATSAVDTSTVTQNLPQEAADLLNGMTPESASAKEGGQKLFSGFLSIFREQIKKACASGFLILGICALVSIGTAFAKSSGLTIPQTVLDLTSVCAILGVCFQPMGSVLTECRRAIEGLSVFIKTLMPVFAAATAVSGKPVSAVSSAAATLLFSNLLISLALYVVLPLITVFILASGMAAASQSELLNRGAALVKWGSVGFFRLFLVVFFTYLTLSGAVTGGVDAAAVKTARVTIAGVVPVLGPVVADASDAILAGASVLRGSIGVYGCIAACAICLVPFVRALTHVLVFKLVAAVSCSFAGPAAAKTIDGITEGYGIALGLLGTCCALLFLSIVVSSVVGV